MVMTMGELAKRTGLPTSTIRYYEKIGLFPAPLRSSGQRRYHETILGRIRVVDTALGAGFTLAEARAFIGGFSDDTPPSVRWQTLAKGKMKEIDERLARTMRMKMLLQTSFDCHCKSLDDCERIFQRADAQRLDV